jgi:hypothetical protein
MATENELINKIKPLTRFDPYNKLKEILKESLKKEGFECGDFIFDNGNRNHFSTDNTNFIVMPKGKFNVIKNHLIDIGYSEDDLSDEEIMQFIEKYIMRVEKRIEKEVDEWVEERLKDVYELNLTDWHPFEWVLSQELIDKGYKINEAENKVVDLACDLLEKHNLLHLADWDFDGGYIPQDNCRTELEGISKKLGYGDADDYLCELGNELWDIIRDLK